MILSIGYLGHTGQIWNVLKSSHETLKTIELPNDVSKEETCLRLWRMRFPQLRSLTLGIWHSDVEGSPDGFTEFVVAHGETLEELDLALEHVFLLHRETGVVRNALVVLVRGKLRSSARKSRVMCGHGSTLPVRMPPARAEKTVVPRL